MVSGYAEPSTLSTVGRTACALQMPTMDAESLLISHSPASKQAVAYARRWQLLAFAVFSSSFFSGTLIGWAGITDALQSSAPGGGGMTSSETTRLFFYSSSVTLIVSIPAGLLLDHLGPRVCFCTANALCSLGAVILLLGAHMSGLVTFAAGSSGIMCSVMHVSSLFVPNHATVVSVLCGTFSVSLIVLPVIGWLFNAGVCSVKAGFIVLAAIGAACAAVGSVVWPDRPFSDMAAGHSESVEAGDDERVCNCESIPVSTVWGALHGALEQMRTPAYLEVMAFMVVPMLWMQVRSGVAPLF